MIDNSRMIRELTILLGRRQYRLPVASLDLALWEHQAKVCLAQSTQSNGLSVLPLPSRIIHSAREKTQLDAI